MTRTRAQYDQRRHTTRALRQGEPRPTTRQPTATGRLSTAAAGEPSHRNVYRVTQNSSSLASRIYNTWHPQTGPVQRSAESWRLRSCARKVKAMAERHEVPIGVEIAAAWSWRLLIVGALGGALIWLMRYFSELTIPVAIALLASALVMPAVDFLSRHKVPRVLAAASVVISLVGLVFGLLALVGQQVATQITDLRVAVVDGITKIQDWARTGPFGISDAQVASWVESGKDAIGSIDSSILNEAGSIGASLTHFVAGFFITLFPIFFFLSEGARLLRLLHIF